MNNEGAECLNGLLGLDYSPYEKLLLCVDEMPDKIAVVFNGYAISYLELNNKILRLAGQLSRMGVESGDRIALYMTTSMNFIVGIYAIMRLNAVFVPLDKRNPESRIKNMINDGAVRFILGEECNPFENEMSVAWMDVSEIIIIDYESKSEYESQFKNHSYHNPYIYLMHTSGSTGTPKGVLVKCIPIRNLIRWYIKYCEIN